MENKKIKSKDSNLSIMLFLTGLCFIVLGFYINNLEKQVNEYQPLKQQYNFSISEEELENLAEPFGDKPFILCEIETNKCIAIIKNTPPKEYASRRADVTIDANGNIIQGGDSSIRNSNQEQIEKIKQAREDFAKNLSGTNEN